MHAASRPVAAPASGSVHWGLAAQHSPRCLSVPACRPPIPTVLGSAAQGRGSAAQGRAGASEHTSAAAVFDPPSGPRLVNDNAHDDPLGHRSTTRSNGNGQHASSLPGNGSRSAASPSAVAVVAAPASEASGTAQPQPPSTSTPPSDLQRSPNMLLLPVSVCKTITLAPQATLADGTAELLRRLPAAAAAHTAMPSGVLRLEVALPRSATTALRWLAGQQQQQQQGQQQPPYLQPPYLQQSAAAAEAAGGPAAAGPFMYFSGRRSSAPDTPGASAAEAATRGWSALAGAGAAWRWWGRGGGGGGEGGADGSSGGGFDSRVVSSLQRFLSPDQPRVRILGGVRFNPRRAPDPEWAPFGSHCFVLPLLELGEAEDCCLLAATLAWDPAGAAAEAGTAAGASDAAGFCGCRSWEEAAARAETALRLMRPPAPVSAYGLHVTRSEPLHSPSRPEWDSHMEALLGRLQEGQDTSGPAAAPLASNLDPGLARQEYLTHGQQGLDDLLAAMTLSASAAAAGGGAAQLRDAGDSIDNLDALRDLIDGKVTVAELAAAAAAARRPGGGGAAAAAAAAAAPGATAPVGSELGSTAAAVAVDAAVDAASGEALSKVVMARRTSMRLEGPLEPLHVLQSLQERDPRAYQLYFAPGPVPVEASPSSVPDVTSNPPPGAASAAGSAGPGPAFLACTPERLYARTGRFVASEAVAGTRPRGRGGDVEQDFWLTLDLLRSAKDHAEFCTVRDWIASQLAGPCEDVNVEIRKSVLKQVSVQHLFGRVAARLRRGRNDAHILAALHPTPAVCGRPREAALGYLDQLESFDRGWYAGPFGWISGAGAEFVVAIRSGLVCPETTAPPETPASSAPAAIPAAPRTAERQLPASTVHLYAGVGVVSGSDPAAEWQELELKIRPLSWALRAPPPPASAPNLNAAWAGLLVEELCRLGVNMFCVAPGSRSSPLTHAIASHPRARLNVCIDERSLGFWALGYGRASGRPAAVVTSSGTAVANLLPAVVEASLSGVPMLLLTADRPAELRDTAANQTIDQTKIFGGFTRWFFDVPPPSPEVPGRSVLTTASTAFRAAVASAPPGPVHLNLQFREPLAPVPTPWASGPFMRGLAQWQESQLPYTSHISGAALPAVPASGLLASTAAGGTETDFGSGSALAGCSGGGADVACLRSLLAGARRGLVVVGELTDPRDIMAARQICAVLGWPVVADVLSGLRVGAPPPPTEPPRSPGGGGSSSRTADPRSYDSIVPVVHHMDHLLLGDRSWWRALRPDVILQLGPHLTSKRLGQFMDWAAMGEDEEVASASAAGVPWVYVANHILRHDPSHLVSHRAVMEVPAFRDAVVAPAAAAAAAATAASTGLYGAPAVAAGPNDPWVGVSGYCRMLLQLDAAVSHEIDVALASLDSVSEPFIARSLARSLPAGHGLFIGNSMPIRDMDMYACPPPPGPASSPAAAAAATPASPGGGSGAGGAAAGSGSTAAPAAAVVAATGSPVVGVPVAANRGASGIDGVLSTAAGFAEGLSRPTTLLVGDLSFLHDINGLNLLRAGELRPPLTVVLINNSGGGIFSFLPIAASVPEDEFTPLWATPQNVDLEAMCRAQGIPHQKVTNSEGLAPALQAAWGLNRHSVVEVITDRSTNVDLHRTIQAAALRAAQHTYTLANLSSSAAAAATSALHRTHRSPSSSSTSTAAAPCPAAATFRIAGLRWQRYCLPLARLLTSTPSEPAIAGSASNGGNDNASTTGTGDGDCSNNGNRSGGGSSSSSSSSGGEAHAARREGLLLRLELVWPDGSPAGEGAGEVAPLPGLHTESLREAEVQVAALSGLLEGVPVPPSLALLGGRLGGWLRSALGLRNPGWLAPSVRFGLESALLSALAAALQTTLADLLSPPSQQAPQQHNAAQLGTATAAAAERRPVLINGLLSPPVTADVAADAAAAAAGAAALVAQGYTAIKVKVARRPDPAADAAVLAAVRAAVGPHIVLRADANRGWASLEAAVAFGRAAAGAGVGLQYVEEPTADPRDMAAFYQQTGVPVAADESLDEGLLLPTHGSFGSSCRSAASSSSSVAASSYGSHAHAGRSAPAYGSATPGAALAPSYSAAGLPADRATGLAAVVVKPAVVGGLEAAAAMARWAQRRGVQVVVSSAFESSVGLAALLQLAAAVDTWQASSGGGGSGGGATAVHHGLGTLQWFAADAAEPPLRFGPQLLPPSASAAPAVVAGGGGSGDGGGVSGADGYLPLQALCGCVEQADRLLRACAQGAGLGSGALVHGAAAASANNGAATERSDPAPLHAAASSNGTCNGASHICVSNGNGSSSNGVHHAATAAAAATHSAAANGTAHGNGASRRNGIAGCCDPWVGPRAHGGVTQRQVCLRVLLHPDQHLNTHHHHHHHGDQSPLRVVVHGLELLPPASVSGDRSRSSNHVQPPPPFLFLHGFLGSSADWLPLMRALAAAGHRCVALDLPGHGATRPVHASAAAAADTSVSHDVQGHALHASGNGACAFAAAAATSVADARPADGQGLPVTAAHTIPGAAACVAQAAAALGLEGAVLVGYSLGARVVLQVVTDCASSGAHASNGADAPAPLWRGAVLVSGTPGIKDPAQAAARAANDDRLAQQLIQGGLPDFVRRWYETPLWSSLRRHPAFPRLLARRTAAGADARAGLGASAKDGDAASIDPADGGDAAAQAAAALSGMSTGRMAPLWDRLDPWVGPPVVLVAGELDAKFVDINTHTLARIVRRRTAAAASGTATMPAHSAVPTGDGDCMSGQATPLSSWDDQSRPPPPPQQQQRGGRSSMGVREQLEQLGSALVLVEDVGHAVQVEGPERLLGVLREAADAMAGDA